MECVSVTVCVLLPDVCTLLPGRTPSSHPQETAPCTGRQTRAGDGRDGKNVNVQSQTETEDECRPCGSDFKYTLDTSNLIIKDSCPGDSLSLLISSIIE